jgi:hypothetical protein
MSILEEMLEMFATTVQAELNATLHVCKSGLQDVLTNRRNFTSNVVFQFLYSAWLVGRSFSFLYKPSTKQSTDRSKVTVTLLHTPIKPYAWTPWNSSIFRYTTIQKNSYPNVTLETETYTNLSKTFQRNTPPRDVVPNSPVRLLQCRIG